MARRRNRNRGESLPPAKPRFYAPTRVYKPRSYLDPLSPYLSPVSDSASASPTLDHPASRRTVRPLIRTVLTDTRGSFPSRRSPDVPRRAQGRSATARPSMKTMLSWGFPLAAPPVFNRAVICAKRAIRREVLFAIRGTGAGSRSTRRFTKDSKERC